jgi:hypothetical protein
MTVENRKSLSYLLQEIAAFEKDVGTFNGTMERECINDFIDRVSFFRDNVSRLPPVFKGRLQGVIQNLTEKLHFESPQTQTLALAVNSLRVRLTCFPYSSPEFLLANYKSPTTTTERPCRYPQVQSQFFKNLHQLAGVQSQRLDTDPVA